MTIEQKLSERVYKTFRGNSRGWEGDPSVKGVMDEMDALEADNDALDKTIGNLVVVNGEVLAKITRLEARLAKAQELLSNPMSLCRGCQHGKFLQCQHSPICGELNSRLGTALGE